MEAHTAGVNATDLWPLISHPAALANVVLFFWLGYLYLGGAGEATADGPAGDLAAAAPRPGLWDPVLARTRGWFDPREGAIGMTRTDWMLAGGIVALAFIVAVIGYGWPPEKIFAEVYFARGGGEYLHGLKQYEWTHPPFTKLFIALSMLLFGGTHG